AMSGHDPDGNYNRILLSGVRAQSHEPADIFINPLAWYEENEIKLHAGVRAARIDPGARVVHGMDGVAEPYDKLVLATGSRALVPPMAAVKGNDGAPTNGLFFFRTLEDCHQVAAYAALCHKAPAI